MKIGAQASADLGVHGEIGYGWFSYEWEQEVYELKTEDKGFAFLPII
jgi:hypothetical protein